MGKNSSSYSNEAELVDVTISMLMEHYKSRYNNTLLKREVGVGGNIADIVIFMWNDVITPPPPLSIHDSVILSVLRRYGPTRIDILESRCGFERGSLRKGALRHLEDHDLLELGAGGRIALKSKWLTKLYIVAIEAKLRDWKNAIRQAAMYSRFADEAYVALPSSTASTIQDVGYTIFKETGVGLMSVNYEIVTPISSKPSNYNDWRREFVASRMLV